MIYQLNSELYKVTGIQRVVMDIHEALRERGAKIVGTVPFEKLADDLKISKGEYKEFVGYKMFRKSTVIIHERRYLPMFWILNNILRYNIDVVYVHHNELYGRKLLSRFPNKVVAISDAGIRNLTEYFGVSHDNIKKIHNCVRKPEDFVILPKHFNPENITILYPARINAVKRQVEIVEKLQDKLDSRVHIHFVGTGPHYEQLKIACGNSDQFVALGYRSDVLDLLNKSDFMMLFSQHEGLPISLIEATMTGTPIVCNAVGGNTEIAKHGKNALVVNTWEELLIVLNKLPEMSVDEYNRLSREAIGTYEREFTFERFKNDYSNLLK